MKKEQFITGTGAPDLVRAVLRYLQKQDLTFDELMQDPRQLQLDAGVPGFINDRDTINFARVHAFDLQIFCNELHYEREHPVGIHATEQQHAYYLVGTLLDYVREDMEAIKRG